MRKLSIVTAALLLVLAVACTKETTSTDATVGDTTTLADPVSRLTYSKCRAAIFKSLREFAERSGVPPGRSVALGVPDHRGRVRNAHQNGFATCFSAARSSTRRSISSMAR